MKRSNNPAKYEVLIKQYLCSILDRSEGPKGWGLHTVCFTCIYGVGSRFFKLLRKAINIGLKNHIPVV